jgi:hypothetical protein
MEIIKEAGRILNLKMSGDSWVREAAPILVEIVKEVKELETRKKEESEPFRVQINDIASKYKPALEPLQEIEAKYRERMVKEAESGESVACENGGKIAFADSWKYRVVDFAKVPKELRMEVVDDKAIRDMIKKGIRNIKGIAIEQVRQLRVFTKEDINE